MTMNRSQRCSTTSPTHERTRMLALDGRHERKANQNDDSLFASSLYIPFASRQLYESYDLLFSFHGLCIRMETRLI